jgi:hypothetical protein
MARMRVGLRLPQFVRLRGTSTYVGLEHAGCTFQQTSVVKIAKKRIVKVDILPLIDRSY